MSDAQDQGLLEALLDSWDRNNTILVNLLRALSGGGLANTRSSLGFMVCCLEFWARCGRVCDQALWFTPGMMRLLGCWSDWFGLETRLKN